MPGSTSTFGRPDRWQKMGEAGQPHVGHQLALDALKRAMDAYAPISISTWSLFRELCRHKSVPKGVRLYEQGVVPRSFAFVYTGLFRVFVTDTNGKEYNKNFFAEGQFPGTMAALLTSTSSRSAIEALEDSVVIEIDFTGFRELLFQAEDLMRFQIHYLEKNWLLAKDTREIELVQDDAQARYHHFLERFPALSSRIPQYHIASHLGITPTQLSRVRAKARS